MVQGAKILISDFSKLPITKSTQNHIPGHLWSDTDQEVEKLLTLERTEHEEDEVISPVFLVQNLMVFTG